MSVSLATVISAGGYDLSTLEDAQWLLSKQSEFDELVEAAEEVVYKQDELDDAASEKEYQEFIDKELQT